MSISSEVRAIVHHAKKIVLTSKTPQELIKVVQAFLKLLDKYVRFDTLQDDEEIEDFILSGIHYTPEFRQEFKGQHYGNFCEHLISKCDPVFLKDDQFRKTIFKLFLLGPSESSLLALVSSLTSLKHTEKLHIVVLILDNFVSENKLYEIFLSRCYPENSSILSDQLITVISSLPDKLANRMKLVLNAKFHPMAYYVMLGKQILKVLSSIYEINLKCTKYTTLFLSKLIGKIAGRGYAMPLFEVLLPQLKTWCYTSPLWSNICSALIVNVPETSLEAVIECLLKKIIFYPFFCKILKDSVLENAIIKHLLTHKFLFLRYYKDQNILENIIGYLSGDTRRVLLIEIHNALLTNWSDSNTLKHMSYEHHFYVTEAVILATVQLNETEISQHKNELIHIMLSGVQTHLESSDSKIRQLGMFTAQSVMPCLAPDGTKLNFEVEDNEDIMRLKRLASSPKFGPHYDRQNFLTMDDQSLLKIVSQNDSEKKLEKCITGNDKENIDASEVVDEEYNDDSDDLQPYEMSEEDNELIEGIRPPKYISQCIDGLLSRDDPKRHIASLCVLKKVVKKDHYNLKHQCIQLVTILLHLDDKYSLSDYNELRFSAMVNITVAYPVKVAEYLTKEFYEQNYCLRQRIDILDVLTAAAVHLSKSEENEKDNTMFLSNQGSVKEYPGQRWKCIVEERIEKKTRRFSKKSSIPTPKSSLNRFGNLVGYFFFPLLKGFDSAVNTFDLLGKDSMVLGCLASSLGNVMYCARGTLITGKMARALLEFVWVLRFHNDACVRQGLLFSLAMTLVSVSGYFLFTELQNELVECQNWLDDVAKDDPSTGCRELAVRNLLLIRQIFEKQFNPD